MHGWSGNILYVDLDSGSSWRERLPEHLLEEYLGGRGLAVRLMRDYFSLDPFDSQMPLIFACGPLCGTGSPAADQLTVLSRSPLTGTLMDCPVGGGFAAGLKSAGLDVLFVTGKSPAPVVIAVGPGGVEILSARELWGRDVPATIAALEGRGSVAAIGPAGENRVLFANMAFGCGNVSGRGGLGAVMGAKKLKAVVVAGDLKTGVADLEKRDKAGQDIMRLFNASPFIFGPLGLSRFGTPVMVDLMAQRRMTPTENFRRTFFQGAVKYSGPAMRASLAARMEGCGDCGIRCRMTSDDGPLPEYETLSHFGALNGIDDLQAIVAASRVCNRMGMDGVSAAATIAARGEIMGRFPSPDELQGLLMDTAMLRGEGALLALGSRRMAQQMGRPELAMGVKSLELPAYDPRGAYGLALGYCTSSHGGCHQQSWQISHEILRKPVPTDRFTFSGKARMVAIAEDTIAALDSMQVCRFVLAGASLEEYAELLTAVTGIDYSSGRLSGIGRRICLTEHFYNCVNGFSRADDVLPERFYTEPGSSGDGITIPPLDSQRFQEELVRYYRIRGLDADGCFDDAGFLDRQP